MIPTVYLKAGRQDSLSRQHPWLFSGAIQDVSPRPAPGDIVRVLSHEGTFVGEGTWESGGLAVRLLSFSQPIGEVDEFLAHRLQQAYALRKVLLDFSQTNVYRLIHSEGDSLSGLIVDIYGHVAVVQLHSAGMVQLLPSISQALLALPGAEIHAVYNKSEATSPLPVEEGFLTPRVETGNLLENGLRLLVPIEKGQKSGFFIDQRDNRQLFARYARGRKVLDLFSYCAGFSLYALAAGASSAMAVDSSARSLVWAQEQIALNETVEQDRFHTMAMDGFQFLEQMPQGAYDLIVMDPPPFIKRRSAYRKGINGYRRLHRLAFEKAAPGTILFTFTSSLPLSANDFRLMILTAAMESGRQVTVLHELTQAPCHPIPINHPESQYLKGLVLHVV